eukprot:6793590-Heterocapsa_arctica.AAC.1
MKFDSTKAEDMMSQTTLYVPVVDPVARNILSDDPEAEHPPIPYVPVDGSIRVRYSPADESPRVRYILSNDPNAEVVGSPRGTDPTSTPGREVVYEKGYPQIAATVIEKWGKHNYTFVVQAKAGYVAK